MIISANLIKKPRKKRKCEDCRAVIVGEQLRLYGAADRGDMPYAIYVCIKCAKNFDGLNDSEIKKIADAIERATK